MEPFRRLESTALPIARDNVDTDQIVPARFLRKPRSDNFGDYLFGDTRSLLEDPARKSAKIVVAGRNFGCGSSREAAVWALCDYGLRAAIAPSFGDIFAGNALKNGFLPVVLAEDEVMHIMTAVSADPLHRVTIDLESQLVNGRHRFEINAFARRCLLDGVDELGYTLGQMEHIVAFEKRYSRPGDGTR
jgi:3-isopropylmalate/(R)-2-methylmalate dehydratase small subunit